MEIQTIPPFGVGDHGQENVSLHKNLPEKKSNEHLVGGFGIGNLNVVCRFGVSIRT